MAIKLTEDLGQALDSYRKATKDTARLKEFEKALAKYNKMVQKGLAKKRGYNLATIEDCHLFNVSFNSTLHL
jgi:hypothetical protein